MGFASAYLEERAIFPELIKEAPSEHTGIIVVVPSYDEPDITKMLDSLALCYEPDCRTEVIIVVNAPDGAGRESLINNSKSIKDSQTWKKEHPGCFFDLYIIDGSSLLESGWSVGLARKTGMDEAVRRFDLLNKPDGIILNLDADCLVKTDYFTAVYGEMSGRKDRSACSIYFEHPVSGNEFSPEVYRSIILYELHMRYFVQGLKFAGFPYAYHTVGSAIAIKAQMYVKAGGMNRRLAGEDFYFILKLVPAGGFFTLNRTVVYPSPRLSSRVPFGTGMTVSRLTDGSNNNLLTYNREAFRELKALFSITDDLFGTEPRLVWPDLPAGIRQFTGIEEWTSKIGEIRRNTSGIRSFRKRFYGWFNMFRIVKYLNSVHSSIMKKETVTQGASGLLRDMGRDFKTDDPLELLRYFRALETAD